MKLKIYLSVLLINLMIPLLSHAKCLDYIESQKPYSEVFNNFDISPALANGRCDVTQYIRGLVNIYAIKDGVLYAVYTEQDSDYPINSVKSIYQQIFPNRKLIMGDYLDYYQGFYGEFIATHYRKYFQDVEKKMGRYVFEGDSEPKKQRVKDRDFFIVKLKLNCNNIMCNELENEIKKDVKFFLSNIPILTEIHSKVKSDNEDAKIQMEIKNEDAKIQMEIKTFGTTGVTMGPISYNIVKSDTYGMLAIQVIVKNNYNFQIKDIKINCKYFAQSGTEIKNSISNRTYTIFQKWSANEKRTLNFDIALVEQTNQIKCEIVDFAK